MGHLESQLGRVFMSIHHLLSFEAVDESLTLTDIVVNPAYLQGVWCGLIIGGQYCPPQEWLDVAFEEAGIWATLSTHVQSILLQLAEQTVVSLGAIDFSFKLLLPSDDLELQVRADALHEWCEGFVLGVNNQQQQQTLLTDDGAQALADLTKISEMDFTTTECEEEEFSYMELVEFVRIAVLTIHQNLLEEIAQNKPKFPPAYLH